MSFELPTAGSPHSGGFSFCQMRHSHLFSFSFPWIRSFLGFSSGATVASSFWSLSTQSCSLFFWSRFRPKRVFPQYSTGRRACATFLLRRLCSLRFNSKEKFILESPPSLFLGVIRFPSYHFSSRSIIHQGLSFTESISANLSVFWAASTIFANARLPIRNLQCCSRFDRIFVVFFCRIELAILRRQVPYGFHLLEAFPPNWLEMSWIKNSVLFPRIPAPYSENWNIMSIPLLYDIN